ncbi:unnamed protein product [Lactuca saligna]|uniref:Uncharacterized protein n=1 Tax=Lactuca saligna TaxID=75948 RepID=A0AA35YYI0_LACSI|nr:unnamed protein product [Lactuca saligna]
MLNVKPNQNPILDLDSSRYSEALRTMIECLRFSPLAQTLTMVSSHKTSITNTHFSKLLGLASSENSRGPIIDFLNYPNRDVLSDGIYLRHIPIFKVQEALSSSNMECAIHLAFQ